MDKLLLAVTSLALVSACSPSAPADGDPVARSAPAPRAASEPADPSIKVHGHWVIDIKDPDGTPRARHEFDNALVESGRRQLVDLLTFSAADEYEHFTAPRWLIDADATGAPSGYFRTTDVQATKSTDKQQLILSGQLTASADATIHKVSTRLYGQMAYGGQDAFVFTARSGLSYPVLNGQIVQFSVTISFE